MALVACGALSIEDVEALWSPSVVLTPSIADDARERCRAEWAVLVRRVEKTIPELSAVEF
jgi:hypothetical protein